MNPKELTVIEHIEELRKRLFICAAYLVVALIGSFYLAEPIIKYIQHQGEADKITLNAFNVADPLTVYLEVTFVVALVITSPIILYQLWAFITPGLHERERKATLKYIPYSFLLFIGGLAFGYFVLFPNVLNFMMNLSNNLEIEQEIGINEYFSFLFKLVVPFGLLFQLPVVTLFLARLGILNPKLMVKFRKYSYFVLFVLAVFLAPPDLISNLLIAIPLFILYEISIVIARIGYKKYEAAEALRVKEEKEAEQKLQVEQALAEQRRQIEEMRNLKG
ncbi:sec-independent protein translocase protein TatC [Ureibacillus xyleni]|uniref:Sec-independent protein translocase protein TatC n=1 Tax=Ureibacillus xyleni TaxID=614648 RepID=A0A285RVX4_9BACL|nr:twin-arginine translocase subunit TatC [Ureibacillus xyleni]SOB98433.1 sec-independent protein translocase protein TatC [Ureibacillus xyleni]